MGKSRENIPNDSWLRRNPPHPGRHIYHGRMEAVEGVYEGVSVTEAAQKLGVSRVTLSRVLNGNAAISVSLALKLEAVGWGKADVWVRRQARYDLARERNRLRQSPGEPALESEAARGAKGVGSLWMASRVGLTPVLSMVSTDSQPSLQWVMVDARSGGLEPVGVSTRSAWTFSRRAVASTAGGPNSAAPSSSSGLSCSRCDLTVSMPTFPNNARAPRECVPRQRHHLARIAQQRLLLRRPRGRHLSSGHDGRRGARRRVDLGPSCEWATRARVSPLTQPASRACRGGIAGRPLPTARRSTQISRLRPRRAEAAAQPSISGC